MKIIQNKPLKNYNTFGIDAKAKYFAVITMESHLQELVNDPVYKENEKLILGGGSNVLFTGDYPGLVIYMDIRGMRMERVSSGEVIMEAGAGENWHEFVEICMKNKYYGLENLALIPGKVGAAPVQNIGAYGAEQKDFFIKLKGFDLETGEFREMMPSDCRFGYRDSVFKNELKGKFIITSVQYRLLKEERLNLTYKELEQEVTKFVVVEPTPQYVFDTVVRIRRQKLPDPEETGNAGSFFKNPLVSNDKFTELREKFPQIPGFPSPAGMKIPAGWLIQQCGWKGQSRGNAGVSDKHALILINKGNASGDEILDLADDIRASVNDKFGITLENEVNVI